MRRLGFLFIIFTSLLLSGQTTDNRFEEAEANSASSGMESKQGNTFVTISQTSEPVITNDSGKEANPADTVPVDDYIPVLLLFAFGIIIRKVYQRIKAV